MHLSVELFLFHLLLNFFALNANGTNFTSFSAVWRNSVTHGSKDGCNDAARILLAHAAFVEAKANVLFSWPFLNLIFKWDDTIAPCCLVLNRIRRLLTVKTLLGYSADCSAEDNEGMAPMNHLSSGPGSAKLRELLQCHLEEQRKKRALEACSETKAKMEELENALSRIAGQMS
ncbi:hypothetical protein GH714_039183 [Hevea brasiliensis]|uniref:Uncharacterized protein n=1 Tax=Hevea brasiliensis TaxID=3981 RepID=A0A6A6LXV3_HEVBR|nr:hypothetical protein GH714_039183 [Hevea brasiliensis]